MQFVKASERLPASSNLVHLTYGKKLGEFKTTGYYEDDTWHYQNGETVTIAGNLHWLDESPPASIEQESARMYPYPKTLTVADWRVDEIIDRERSAHIRCAGMYTGEVERLKNEVARLEAENKALIEEIQNWKDELKDQAREYRNNR